jgi:hypothetical protein
MFFFAEVMRALTDPLGLSTSRAGYRHPAACVVAFIWACAGAAILHKDRN